MKYRPYEQMTARRPVLELVLGGILIGFVLAAGNALVNVLVEVLQ